MFIDVIDGSAETPGVFPPEDPRFFLLEPRGEDNASENPTSRPATDDDHDFRPRWWPGEADLLD